MIKQLLACAAVAVASLNVSAAEVTLWEGSCDFGTSWSESFSIPASDLAVLDSESAVLTLYYTLDSSCSYWQYKMCSNGSGWTALNVSTELGNDYQCISLEANSTKTDCPLKAEDIATIKANGLRVQGYGATVTKVTCETDKVIDENLLWEGECTPSWSVQGAVISASKLKAGDLLQYTFSETSSSFQILLKGANWSNLLGTEKITQNDVNSGTVIVGVTQMMLDNCGANINVQGDGGCVLSKVERIGSFDATGVIAYGERASGGTSVFATLPESTTQLSVVFKTAPNWAQLCNSSWTDLEAASTNKTNADGTVTYTFTLTSAMVEAINEKQELIINGDANVLAVSIPSGDQTGIADVELNGQDAPVEFFNLQGVRVDNPAAGLYIRRQGSKVSKVIIK